MSVTVAAGDSQKEDRRKATLGIVLFYTCLLLISMSSCSPCRCNQGDVSHTLPLVLTGKNVPQFELFFIYI